MLWRPNVSAFRALSNSLQMSISPVPSLPSSATAVIPTHLSLRAACLSQVAAMPGHMAASNVSLSSTCCRHHPGTGHTSGRHLNSSTWPMLPAARCQHRMLPPTEAPTHSRQQQQQRSLQPRPLLRMYAAQTGEAQVQPPLDAIHIRGARFYGYHGVLPAENAVGQPFMVDISLYLDLKAAGRSDDLQHTVSYAEVFDEVRQVMEGPPHQLLESLAHTIAHKVMVAHAMVHATRISISKCHIPKLSAAVGSVGVEVYRTVADFSL